MKRFNKLISSVVLVCFILNTAVQDYAFGLATMPGSTQPDTRNAMYAAGQKKLATKEYGPGSGISARMDGYVPGQFTGDVPDAAGLKFVPSNYVNGTPRGWDQNVLLKGDISDLVEAFKYFRDKEANLTEAQLEIVEGDFKLENGNNGEIPVCRIEQDKDMSRFRLVIHKDFVRMWADVKKNDVWFEYTFPDEKVRTVSLAWAIFYRIAKHEMSDIVSRGGKDKFTAKSHGHMEYSLPFFEWSETLKVSEDEIVANAIRGRYAIVNDAIWMWFLGSYCFGPATQYSDTTFKDRALWFLGLYEGPNAEAWNRWSVENNLPDEFPNLHNATARAEALGIARTVNKTFYSKYKKYEAPRAVAKDVMMQADLARRRPNISRILPATGKSATPRTPSVSGPRMAYLSDESRLDLRRNAEETVDVVGAGLMCADRIHQAKSSDMLRGMRKNWLSLGGAIERSIDPDGRLTAGYLAKLPGAVRDAISDYSRIQSGGPITSSMRVLAQLAGRENIDAEEITSVGQDGAPFLAAQESLGVRVRNVNSRPGLPTASTLVFELKDANPGDRGFHHDTGASAELTIDKLKPEYFKGKKIAAFGGVELTALMKDIDQALDMAKAAGCITVFDTVVDNPRQWRAFRKKYGADYLKVLLGKIDVFTPSIDEARQIMADYENPVDEAAADKRKSVITPEELISFFAKHGAKAVFLKASMDGVYVRTTKDSVFKEDASFTVPILRGFRAVSGTGTGDAFTGAAIYALSHGWNARKAAMFSNVVGGMCVQYNGGTIGQESLVDALYYMERLKAQMLAEVLVDPDGDIRTQARAILESAKLSGNTRFVDHVNREIANALYLKAFPATTALPHDQIEAPDFGLGDFNNVGLLLEVVTIFNKGGGRGHTGKILINAPNQLLIEHLHKTVVVLRKSVAKSTKIKGYTYIKDVVPSFKGIDAYNADGSPAGMKYSDEEYSIFLADSDASTLPAEYKEYLVEEIEGKSETFMAVQGDGVLLTDDAKVLSVPDGSDPYKLTAEWQARVERVKREQRITTKGAIYMKAGTVVLLPKGTKHAFLAGDEGAVYVEFSGPSLDPADDFTDRRVVRQPKEVPLEDGRGSLSLDAIIGLRSQATPDKGAKAAAKEPYSKDPKIFFNQILSRGMPLLPDVNPDNIVLQNGRIVHTVVSHDIGDGKGHVGKLVANMPGQYAAPVVHAASGTFKCVYGSSIMFIDDPKVVRAPPAFDPFAIPFELEAAFREAAAKGGFAEEIKGMKMVHVVPGVEIRVPDGTRYANFAGDNGYLAMEFSSPEDSAIGKLYPAQREAGSVIVGGDANAAYSAIAELMRRDEFTGAAIFFDDKTAEKDRVSPFFMNSSALVGDRDSIDVGFLHARINLQPGDRVTVIQELFADTGLVRDIRLNITAGQAAAVPERRAFHTRQGKSPEDLLRLISSYVRPGDIITAPILYDLYAAHYKEFNFEAPAKRSSALRTIERDLFEADGSLLALGIVKELPDKGPKGERRFVEVMPGDRKSSGIRNLYGDDRAMALSYIIGKLESSGKTDRAAEILSRPSECLVAVISKGAYAGCYFIVDRVTGFSEYIKMPPTDPIPSTSKSNPLEEDTLPRVMKEISADPGLVGLATSKNVTKDRVSIAINDTEGRAAFTITLDDTGDGRAFMVTISDGAIRISSGILTTPEQLISESRRMLEELKRKPEFISFVASGCVTPATEVAPDPADAIRTMDVFAENRQKRVLVTGGAGYFGSVLTRYLMDRGVDVWVIDDESTGHAQAVPEEIKAAGRYVKGDVTDTALLKRLMVENRIDTVYHLAAKTLMGDSVEYPALYNYTNVIGTLSVAEAIRQAQDESGEKIVLLNTSTCGVWDDEAAELKRGEGLSETSSVRPTAPYTETKLLGENVLGHYRNKYGVVSVSVRPFNIVGAYQTSDGQWWGEDTGHATHLITVAGNVVLGRQPKLTIFGNDFDTNTVADGAKLSPARLAAFGVDRDGTAIREYIHVLDESRIAVAYVDYVRECLARGEPVLHRVLGGGTGTPLSTLKVVGDHMFPAAIELGMRPDNPPAVIGTRRDGDDAVKTLNTKTQEEILGIRPTKSIDDIVRSHLEFIRARRNGYGDDKGNYKEMSEREALEKTMRALDAAIRLDDGTKRDVKYRLMTDLVIAAITCSGTIGSDTMKARKDQRKAMQVTRGNLLRDKPFDEAIKDSAMLAEFRKSVKMADDRGTLRLALRVCEDLDLAEYESILRGADLGPAVTTGVPSVTVIPDTPAGNGEEKPGDINEEGRYVVTKDGRISYDPELIDAEVREGLERILKLHSHPSGSTRTALDELNNRLAEGFIQDVQPSIFMREIPNLIYFGLFRKKNGDLVPFVLAHPRKNPQGVVLGAVTNLTASLAEKWFDEKIKLLNIRAASWQLYIKQRKLREKYPQHSDKGWVAPYNEVAAADRELAFEVLLSDNPSLTVKNTIGKGRFDKLMPGMDIPENEPVAEAINRTQDKARKGLIRDEIVNELINRAQKLERIQKFLSNSGIVFGLLSLENMKEPEAEAIIDEMVRAQRLGALYVPEIALRGTRADIDRALKLISAMRTKYPDAIIAAGSVSDPDSSQRAVAAGVNIVITPGFLLGKADIDYNRSRGCETCLGIGSLKEALEAKAAGLKYAKAFPLRIKAKPEDDIEIIQRALIDVFKGPLVDDLRPYLSKVRISRAEGAEEATYANIRRFVEGKPTEDKVFMLVPWGVELVETLQGVFTDAAVTATGGATDEDIATMRLERGLNMAKSVKNLDEAKRTAAMLLEESRVRGLLAQASREAGPTASGGEAVNVDIIRQWMDEGKTRFVRVLESLKMMAINGEFSEEIVITIATHTNAGQFMQYLMNAEARSRDDHERALFSRIREALRSVQDPAVSRMIGLARLDNDSVTLQVRPITEIIDTYFADPRNGYGPGVLTPSPAEIASFYPAISMLENERVEVYLPKDISDSLTRSVTEEIRRMNIVIRERIRKHTGRKDVADPIEIIPYDSVNIEACLKRNGDGVRRIFVNDTTMTAEFRRLTESESGLDILRGRRIVTMSLPKGRDETEKTVNQAWLIKVSLLSALLDESNILTVGASLKDEISGRISDNPVRFVENLAKAEGDAASRDAIRARVNYFMNTIVKLSTFIGEQLRILKAFWIAA